MERQTKHNLIALLFMVLVAIVAMAVAIYYDYKGNGLRYERGRVEGDL